MVYLTEIIKRCKSELLTDGSLQAICYYYLKAKNCLPKSFDPNLGEEETLATKGYLGIEPSTEEIYTVVTRKPIKQLDYTKNIFKLLGIYLAASDLVKDKIETKYQTSSIEYKYLISRVLPDYHERFIKSLQHITEETLFGKILEWIFLNKDGGELEVLIAQLLDKDLDVIDLLILEDLQHCLITQSLSTTYNDLSARELVKRVLVQFGNAVKKITLERRKDHDSFEINDEYDVQDLLYVMLKPLFPSLIVEDPAPKVGTTFTKIDLIIREEGIVIEVKMIKRSDSDEKPFIGQLKNDIQSYYLYPNMKDLLVYVYDPYNKTRDLQNFYALNGEQVIQGVRFEIEVIVGN